MNERKKENLIYNNNFTKFLLDLPDERLLDFFTIKMDVKVKNIVPISSGKWPSAMGNAIAIDADGGRDLLIDNGLRWVRDFIEEYKFVKILGTLTFLFLPMFIENQLPIYLRIFQ